MTRASATLAIAACLIASGLDAAFGATFVVPRADILEKVKVIALVPTDVDEVVPSHEAVAARYDAMIAERLRAAGFEVIPAEEMRSVRKRILDTLGGLYDPMTGEPIGDRIAAYNDFVNSEYAAKHRYDALLSIGVTSRDASFIGGGAARWDGVEESSTGLTGAKGFWTSFNTAAVDGTIPALSLRVVLYDRSQKAMYGAFGGLQLLSYYRAAFWSAGYVDVQRDALMTDPLRDQRALEIALDPLLKGPEAVEAERQKRVAEAKALRQAARNRKPGDAPAAAEPPSILPAPVDPRAERMARPAGEQPLSSRFPVVAIAPLAAPPIKQREEVVARYESLLRTYFERAGFTVLPPDHTRELWREAEKEAGGVYSAVTGRLVESRRQEAWARVRSTLAAAHGTVIVARPAIEVRVASFTSGLARWDGASQLLTNNKSMLGAMFNPDSAYSGRVPALSLQLDLEDPEGAPLFQGFGGLQILGRLVGGEFADVPEPELFSDPARDDKAVVLALGKLLPQPAADKARR